MKIFLHEITDLETELEFRQPGPSDDAWVLRAVERVDESSDDLPGASLRPAAATPPREVTAHFSLRKVDDVVVVTGNVDTHIRLICSRCANYFDLPCQPRFSGLFCKDPVMAGVGHLEGKGKPAGQTGGFARHAHDEGREEDVSEGKDLDITYLAADYIDLADVVTEQLQLQIPFQPLCQESCKGICANCGADLNVGRCACAKLTAKKSPFSALRDLKF